MKTPRLLAVLICLLILVPLVWGEEVIRHQDPEELPAENPYWLNLYTFYDLAYNSIVAERFSNITGWLRYADEIYATVKLAEPLKGFSGLIHSVSTDLNATKSQIDVARKYLQQFNLDGASTALDRALVNLRAANATVDRLDVSVNQIASTLKASPDPLLQDDQKLRELIARYKGMIDGIRSDVTFYKIIHGEPTKLLLTVDPDTVKVGDMVNVFGRLTNSSGVGMSSRSVSIYFDDELVTDVFTLGDGSFSVVLKAPYVYKESLIVRAEYRPTVEDLYSYLPSFAEAVLNLIYYTPTLDVIAPDFVYPGSAAGFTGYLSYGSVPVQGSVVRVIGLGGSNVALTGADGGFSETVSVPDDYPASSALVVVHAESRGVYGPVERLFNVNVVRVMSTVSVNSDSWAFSGYSILVKGSVLAGGSPLGGCRVVVKGGFGEFSTETRVDGSYEVSCNLPVSVFTGINDFGVYAYPVEPWIDSSYAEAKVLVVNVFTIFVGVVLAGYGAYSLSKRVKAKPKKLVVAAPVVEAVSYGTSVEVESVEVKEQKDLKSIILGAIDYVVGVTGLEFKSSATIREYLSNVRARLRDDAYELFSNLMLSYERWLYGRPAGQDNGFLSKILERLRGLRSDEG